MDNNENEIMDSIMATKNPEEMTTEQWLFMVDVLLDKIQQLGAILENKRDLKTGTGGIK